MISRLLLPGFASGAPRDVLLCAKISAHTSQADPVQRTIGFPVATTVETVADDLAGEGFDGRDPAQDGEGGLAAQPPGFVPSHDQQRRGVLGADVQQGDRLRACLRHQPVEVRL
jgi:hypothetical protein